MQFDWLDAGMPFNRQQCVGRLDRSMLARITRQNHPCISFSHQPEQFKHLTTANLSGLVHNYHCALNQFMF